MRARRGSSLFEAVAGLAVVGIVTASALGATGAEMRTAARARQALEVEALATARLDLLSLTTDRELQSLPDSIGRGTFDAPLDRYRWRTTVTPVAEEPGLYAVQVEVLWDDGVRAFVLGEGRDARYVLRSRLYRRPTITAAARGGRR